MSAISWVSLVLVRPSLLPLGLGLFILSIGVSYSVVRFWGVTYDEEVLLVGSTLNLGLGVIAFWGAILVADTMLDFNPSGDFVSDYIG
jgi:hypothetical protein